MGRAAPAQALTASSSGAPRHAAPSAVATEGRATAHRVADEATKARRGELHYYLLSRI